jgi:hypothetical protein
MSAYDQTDIRVIKEGIEDGIDLGPGNPKDVSDPSLDQGLNDEIGNALWVCHG